MNNNQTTLTSLTKAIATAIGKGTVTPTETPIVKGIVQQTLTGKHEQETYRYERSVTTIRDKTGTVQGTEPTIYRNDQPLTEVDDDLSDTIKEVLGIPPKDAMSAVRKKLRELVPEDLMKAAVEAFATITISSNGKVRVQFAQEPELAKAEQGAA
ncbi:MAG: hypothetical protein WD716_11380 [Fimbriimonadaceae bacterium]